VAVTIKDIAKRVGKSVTTVSRALHDYDDVSPETKALVRQVASEIGYSPSSIAQRLQKQKTDTIGLVIPTYGPRFSDPFFSEFLAGVGNKAASLGYDLLVSTQPPGDREIETYQKLVDGRRVDGFIIVRVRSDDERINYSIARDICLAAFGCVEGEANFPYVDEDGSYGMGLVAKHLIQKGHRKFAYIAPESNLAFATRRWLGFCQELKKQGIQIEERYRRTGNLTQRSGFEQSQDLLSLPDPPTAIVACNDLMAIGAMSAAQEKGWVVGKDVAITGFDDIPAAEHSHPPLTTVHQPVYKIGGMVTEMLIKKINSQDIEEEHITLKPSLIVRQSCGGL
jgi:LacI family transcriptional regulator